MKTLVIIGAGFSGTVAAVEFLRCAPAGARLIIINRSGSIARGLAYGTSSSQHLLNVPAGNMTALVDEPDSFLRYCQSSLPETTESSFISRKSYGDYLASLLDSAELNAKKKTNVERITSEVKSLTPQENGALVELCSGKKIFTDQVILAFGHFPPRTPPLLQQVINTPIYMADPWSGPVSTLENSNSPILLIGGGLTALDVISSLRQTAHTGQIYMLSRRGLLPLAHRTTKNGSLPAASFREKLLKAEPTALNYFRLIKAQVKSSAKSGANWRDVIAAVRPITSDLWIKLPESERRRFLRHAQPYWDVHRHRVAPETHKHFKDEFDKKKITAIAGRIKSVDVCRDSALVTIQLRNTHTIKQIKIDRIINCTGPSSNPEHIKEPLIQQLINDGLISVDNQGLGLIVDNNLAVKSKDGSPSEWLSYVGPMLKASFWEATAVPELRLYASALAKKVSRKLSSTQD
ncbi:FAD/NAD(P)-binding protein [Pseudomonas sp. H11T01]|uniref:FAD/NAD(P)-binding protein n=1 Tax=Pseudomonas sp. H11T01 TaxID=3402749 RepID=UPI003AD40968